MASKYGNHKVTYDGIKFDSKKEMNRYIELKLLQRAGKISDLQLQVPFVLLQAGNGERGVKYIADFVYIDADGNKVVEDVKSGYGEYRWESGAIYIANLQERYSPPQTLLRFPQYACKIPLSIPTFYQRSKP